MTRRLLALLALLSLSACSTREVTAWLAWWEEDPDAAVEFANRPEIQAELRGELGLADGVGIPGDCDSYADDMAAAGLPVSTFLRIARRESGCDHTRFTDDHDDLGGFLLGQNFRTAGLRAGWLRWCGATLSNVRFDVTRQMTCAAEAYDRMGLAPWS